MRIKIVVTTAVLFATTLAAPAKARSPVHAAQVLESKQCQKCNGSVADVKDARQELIEQRQQLREARQEVIEQRQQLQDIPQDARQERIEQRQQLQEARQEVIEQHQQLQEVRQEVREQHQQLPDIPQDIRQELTEQQQQLQEALQERTEQRQQLQDIPQDARPERIEQRQQLQEAHQEVMEQRQQLQDVRQDARREVIEQRQQQLDTWWQWKPEDWQYENWQHFYPNVRLYSEPDNWQHFYPTVTGSPASTVSSIRVDFVSLTNDQVTVLIEGVNGKQELAFNGSQTKQTIYLSPGVHKLWFKNTQGSSWISGTLNLGLTNLIQIEFNKDKRLVQVYNDLFA
ncbi:MAG: hypothetical protein F6K28_42345 [Microcoleus sp. SIO2G3]|nr:hypothetical protein [Microcoleus sp. SIO2G3]